VADHVDYEVFQSSAPILAPSSTYALIASEPVVCGLHWALVVWRKRAWRLRIVRRSDAVGLEVLPKHWIVETNVSVAQPQSRFARDLERYPTPSKDLFASKRSASSSGGSLQTPRHESALPGWAAFYTLKYVSDQKIR
jgi:hypothetical protein